MAYQQELRKWLRANALALARAGMGMERRVDCEGCPYRRRRKKIIGMTKRGRVNWLKEHKPQPGCCFYRSDK